MCANYLIFSLLPSDPEPSDATEARALVLPSHTTFDDGRERISSMDQRLLPEPEFHSDDWTFGYKTFRQNSCHRRVGLKVVYLIRPYIARYPPSSCLHLQDTNRFRLFTPKPDYANFRAGLDASLDEGRQMQNECRKALAQDTTMR